ncbi:hypothetical protein LDENG_00007000 [Lucifuga dentata]|nr:hypothetical protein LDENG_00007000 [Lucifuga dentata]
MVQPSTPEECQDKGGFKDLPQPSSLVEDSICPPHQIHPPACSNSELAPVPSPSTEALPTCTPPPVMTVTGSPAFKDPEDEVLPTATRSEAESDEVANSTMLPHPEELAPIQPMEEEVSGSDTADAKEASENDPSQPDSAEMESLTASERDQPERERCSSSDSIPSLAAALLELHQLLVSNNRSQSQNCSTSCSPSNPFRQDTDGVDDYPAHEPRTLTPENTQPTPSTAITAGAEPSNAKANHAAVFDEGPSKCLVPDPSGQDEHLHRDTDTVVEPGPPQYPDDSWERGADTCGQDEPSNISISQPEPTGPSGLSGDLEFREPPEGQQGRGVADGRASGRNTPDTLSLQTEQTFLSPVSMTVGSPEEVSSTSSPSVPPLAQAPQPTSPAPLLPAPNPFFEQFPAEHIERIQAAGFSAREAAEALEQAHGIVELALLALLARSITVPT